MLKISQKNTLSKNNQSIRGGPSSPSYSEVQTMKRYQYFTKYEGIIDACNRLRLSGANKHNAKEITENLFKMWVEGSQKMSGEKVDKHDVYSNLYVLIEEEKLLTLNQVAKIAKQYGISKAVLEMRINDFSKVN